MSMLTGKIHNTIPHADVVHTNNIASGKIYFLLKKKFLSESL